MESGLKPCPFCGGSPDIWRKWGRIRGGGAWWLYVQCPICKCRTNGEPAPGWEDVKEEKELDKIFESQQALHQMELWNNRRETR